MLSDNIKRLRKEKGISQEELAEKLNVVRQTVSKWENGLSVPDAEMLMRIADTLDTTVNILLNSTKNDEISESHSIDEKLNEINNILVEQKEKRRKILRIIFCIVFIVAIIILTGRLANLIHYKMLINDLSSSTTIIGGYDGPTNILTFIKTADSAYFISVIIIVIISIIGIYRTRKR